MARMLSRWVVKAIVARTNRLSGKRGGAGRFERGAEVAHCLVDLGFAQRSIQGAEGEGEGETLDAFRERRAFEHVGKAEAIPYPVLLSHAIMEGGWNWRYKD